MDKAITTGLMLIAGIVATMALVNAVMPAVGKSSGALLTANSAASDRIRTDIAVIHVAANTSPAGEDQILVWVKSVGSNVIAALESTDIFLTTPSTITRIPFGSGVGTWSYTIQGSTVWTQGVTVEFILHLPNGSVLPGAYNIKITVYNSVSAEKDFSV